MEYQFGERSVYLITQSKVDEASAEFRIELEDSTISDSYKCGFISAFNALGFVYNFEKDKFEMGDQE